MFTHEAFVPSGSTLLDMCFYLQGSGEFSRGYSAARVLFGYIYYFQFPASLGLVQVKTENARKNFTSPHKRHMQIALQCATFTARQCALLNISLTLLLFFTIFFSLSLCEIRQATYDYILVLFSSLIMYQRVHLKPTSVTREVAVVFAEAFPFFFPAKIMAGYTYIYLVLRLDAFVFAFLSFALSLFSTHQ